MHKKTLNILAICIVLVLVVFSITYKSKKGSQFSSNISVNENGEIQTKADEYQSNIVQTVAEENVKNFQKFAKTFEKSSGDNITDGLSKDIFTQYIKYNTSGQISQDDIMTASQQVLQNKKDLSNPTTYAEIKVSASSLKNLKIYANNVAVIENGVNKGIASLNPKKDNTPYIANIYLKAAQLFTGIYVPESLSESHLAIINGYKKYNEGLIMMEQQNRDPAKALIGLTKVKDATTEITENFEKIKKTIILNKVSFTQDEPGYMWIDSSADNTSIKLE